MKKIVLASNNPGKIHEINQLVTEQQIQIIPQAQVGVPDIEETGLTFIENALMKARHATAITQLPAISDDSGLVVPALNGEPGIFSARYAGPEANPKKNIEKLLQRLKQVPLENRQAYFYCVIVLLRSANDPCPIICEGKWQGIILDAPHGDQGFGYDPIFYDTKYHCSAAELSLEVKNSISHRGQAMKKLLKKIVTIISAS